MNLTFFLKGRIAHISDPMYFSHLFHLAECLPAHPCCHKRQDFLLCQGWVIPQYVQSFAFDFGTPLLPSNPNLSLQNTISFVENMNPNIRASQLYWTGLKRFHKQNLLRGRATSSVWRHPSPTLMAPLGVWRPSHDQIHLHGCGSPGCHNSQSSSSHPFYLFSKFLGLRLFATIPSQKLFPLLPP